jgi:predicted CoA-substrate-specific enzyme activase
VIAVDSKAGGRDTFYVGVNIGALTVKVVALKGDEAVGQWVRAHQGRPREVLEELLSRKEIGADRFVGVSGHLGHISEVAAIQRALEARAETYDGVASLGGESFLVYAVRGKRILSVLSHNKCAAGSGEFFVQQIGRMELGMEEAMDRAFAGKLVPLASRCSVHCKSDITHKLNRGEATVEDILYSIHDSMADKIVALLEKTQQPMSSVLLIGGVSRNRALVAALRRKLPKVELVVLPESSCFEALGAALLTRDEPRFREPRVLVKPSLSRLPPLRAQGDRNRVLPEEARETRLDGPLILGVDAGSTTTKAVLLHPETRRVISSHYGRTGGDPVRATRECIRRIAEEVGNVEVGLVGTTGSARELAGAYLGTAHVYNEISSHAAGAAHYDPEVDTIFEIGGQDSKYIYLRKGVPIDYAMNAACSAGTGSFLEESARGDLGIAVDEIAERALAASSPVHFKATCAAFINSDIRLGLQEGYEPSDIAAGLVYAIAENYLTKVKGPRFVGKKVFLQGGVALNHAVGNAFAYAVGREVLIPPSPELLGAQGVALLALERSRGTFDRKADLLSLAEPSMELLGRFTCKACKLYCSIDRFQVAGRRFPFGGRCSLYEHLWQRRTRAADAADLVSERSKILFGTPLPAPPPGAKRVGIPKALTTHSLYPLYAAFLSRLEVEIVLSGVNPKGDLKTHSGFCFPTQIAHGAVLDLIERGVDWIFFPQVARMPSVSDGQDCYLCPIAQAGPYVVAKAFPESRFLSPVLDFSKGYASCPAMVEMAVKELGCEKSLAEEAYRAAVSAQLDAERSLQEMGRRALERAASEGQPSVVLVGRSYNAFTPEASQSVGKKLSSMGVLAIPSDCLPPVETGSTSWHFPNQILNAMEVVRRNEHLFLLYISNFSCTIDAFTHSLLSDELGAKPYLMLEIDSHTADAGIQTRLEAFLDIVENYRASEAPVATGAKPCRIGRHGIVTASSGEEVAITDPRVKLYFPTFSEYHSDAWRMAVRWLGLHPGEGLPLGRRQLETGLRYTSGRECLPLPICVGQILEVAERRQKGEIAGFTMLRGGAPCVIDSYAGYLERFIARQDLRDLFVLFPTEENDYCGIGPQKLTEYFAPALGLADLLVEVEQSLRVVGGAEGVARLREVWHEYSEKARSLEEFRDSLPGLIDELARIPRSKDPASCPRVLVTGDFFTRFSPFFMEGVPEMYAAHGIILKPADLGELVLYAVYDTMSGMARQWDLEPGYAALARSCFGILRPEGRQYLEQWKGYQMVRAQEHRLRKEFKRTGLLVADDPDVSRLFREAEKHVSPSIFGEVIPTIGFGVEARSAGYNGILLLGPFNCLALRISEAILKPLCYRLSMPILTYESDGYAVPPVFLRQVEVHIQQVLDAFQASGQTGSGRSEPVVEAEAPLDSVMEV